MTHAPDDDRAQDHDEDAVTGAFIPRRARLRFGLLQVRNAGDPAREDELRAFCDKLGVRRGQVRVIDALTDPLGPDSAEGLDALLVGGAGQYSVLDDDPRIRAFVDYLAAVSHTGLPVFASCFGYQGLVLGLGGEVIAAEDRAEVGTYDLWLTKEGEADPLFSELGAAFLAQLGHKDQAIRLPSGMLNLASSERTPMQALRIEGQPVYGTQFHPELSSAENRGRFLRYMKEYGKLFGDEAAQRQLDSHRPSEAANRLLGRFVDLVVLPRVEGAAT